MSKTAQLVCDACEEPAPVFLVFNGADWPVFEKKTRVLCPACFKVHKIARRRRGLPAPNAHRVNVSSEPIPKSRGISLL